MTEHQRERSDRTGGIGDVAARERRGRPVHGLVQRSPDPRDGRVSLLSPTPEGREKLLTVREHTDERLIGSLERWNVAEIRQLTVLLRALSQGESPERD